MGRKIIMMITMDASAGEVKQRRAGGKSGDSKRKVTEAVWQWLMQEEEGSERDGHIDSQGATFFLKTQKKVKVNFLSTH